MFKDYAREVVPQKEGVSGWHIGLVYIGVGLALPAFLAGAQYGKALGLSAGMLAVLAAGTILAITGAFTGAIGAKTRVSTYMITQVSFGKWGAKLINILMALTLFGWFGVTIAMFAQAINTLFASYFGLIWGETVWSIIGGVLMVSTAIWGFKGLDKLSLVAVPLIALLLLITNWSALQVTSFTGVLAIPGDGSLGFGVVVSLLAGAWMVGAVILPDISRYGRSAKDGVLGAFLCFLPGLFFIIGASMIPALAMNETDIIKIITGFGWPVFSTFILLMAAWSSNDNNLYSASLSLASIIPNVEKWKITLLAGCVGTLLAVLGIMENFITFLVFLGVFVPPVAGVYVTDYLMHRKKYVFKASYKSENFRLLPLVAWGTGSFTAFCTLPVNANGFGFMTITTVPALDALLVSASVHFVLAGGLFKRAK